MERTAQSLLDEAMGLPEAERADLAGALLQSLEPKEESEVETAWRKEVIERIRAYDAGEVEAIPWEVVRSRLQARLNECPEG